MVTSPSQDIIPTTFNAPLGLNPELFLTSNKGGGTAATAPATVAISAAPIASADDALMADVLLDHAGTLSELSQRLTGIRLVASTYQRDEGKGAARAVADVRDPAVTHDVVSSVFNARPELYSLSIAATLMPPLHVLLESGLATPSSPYAATVVEALDHVLQAFGTLIRETLAGPATGLTLALEERRERAVGVARGLLTIRPMLDRLSGDLGRRAMVVALSIDGLGGGMR